MLIITGQLRSIKDGRSRRILPEWVEAYVQDRAKAAEDIWCRVAELTAKVRSFLTAMGSLLMFGLRRRQGSVSASTSTDEHGR
jgi:hypothetical protein